MGKDSPTPHDVFDVRKIRRLVELMNDHEIATIDRQQADLAQRLEMAAVYTQLTTDPIHAADPIQRWRQAAGLQQTVARGIVDGDSRAITLTCRREETGRLPGQLLVAVLWAAVTGLVVLGLRRGTIAETFKRWPAAVGVAVGLAWWLWLSPSILGWAIVAASLLASWRTGWKQPVTTSGSSIISIRTAQR